VKRKKNPIDPADACWESLNGEERFFYGLEALFPPEGSSDIPYDFNFIFGDDPYFGNAKQRRFYENDPVKFWEDYLSKEEKKFELKAYGRPIDFSKKEIRIKFKHFIKHAKVYIQKLRELNIDLNFFLRSVIFFVYGFDENKSFFKRGFAFRLKARRWRAVYRSIETTISGIREQRPALDLHIAPFKAPNQRLNSLTKILVELRELIEMNKPFAKGRKSPGQPRKRKPNMLFCFWKFYLGEFRKKQNLSLIVELLKICFEKEFNLSKLQRDSRKFAEKDFTALDALAHL